jgi:hypothetical protein
MMMTSGKGCMLAEEDGKKGWSIIPQGNTGAPCPGASKWMCGCV